MAIQDDRPQAQQDYFGCLGTTRGLPRTLAPIEIDRPRGKVASLLAGEQQFFKSRGDTSEIRESTRVASARRGRHGEPV